MMKKKTIAMVMVLALVLTGVAATVVVANDEPTRQQLGQQVFFQEVDTAVVQGLITLETADRIKGLWQQKPEGQRPQLYQRVTNMLESKRQQTRIQHAFFTELNAAVDQGLITQEKANYIKDLWEQKPEAEHLQLYQRVKGFLDSIR